ncbi:MAG: hypothetical protein MI861_09500, partial [Pirellulales bacterium]|nr:hypothetical protein [Pirellulales bacterium]
MSDRNMHFQSVSPLRLERGTLLGWLAMLVVCCGASMMASAMASAQEPADASPQKDAAEVASQTTPPEADPGPEQPWDYSPYRVLLWVFSDDPAIDARRLDAPLRRYLDLDFAALWRMDIADAPIAVRSAASRNIHSLSYDLIAASDPVIAVKRDHPEAVRIRVAANVGQIVKKVLGTRGRIEDVKRRAAQVGNDSVDGIEPRLEVVEGDDLAVQSLWEKKETEALLVSRGMAQVLDDPVAKLITPTISGLVGQAVKRYDKIFIIRIDREEVPHRVFVVEMDTLMRHFGPVAVESTNDLGGLVSAVGRGVTEAFAPVVRIDNAGQRSAQGLLRAGGLILNENSPASVGKDDVLEPMTRKNDRNGKPIIIGAIDWAFLYVSESEGSKLKMDYYSGRPGGL